LFGLLLALVAGLLSFGFLVPVMLAGSLLHALVVLALLRTLLTGVVIHVVVLRHTILLCDAQKERVGGPAVAILNMQFIQ
jgi:hypothetical protein